MPAEAPAKRRRHALQPLPANHDPLAAAQGPAASAPPAAAAGRPAIDLPDGFRPPTEEDDIQDILFDMASIDYASQEVLEEPTRQLTRKRALLLDEQTAAAAAAAAAAATDDNVVKDRARSLQSRSKRNKKRSLAAANAVASSAASNSQPTASLSASAACCAAATDRLPQATIASLEGEVPPPMAPLHPPAGVEDIDLARARDPAYCYPYGSDSFAFLRQLQFRDGQPDATFINNRADGVRPNMRAVLVDWIVEVSEDFAMSSDVLHLSVATVDRALKKLHVPPNLMQLLGCAAMLLAAKFEDVFAPSLTEFVEIADNAYTRSQVINMECRVLSALDFRLMACTAKPFLRRFQRAAHVDHLEKALSNYVCELTLSNVYFNGFTPSVIAAACVYYARLCLFKQFEAGGVVPAKAHGFDTPARPCPPMWSSELRWYSGYEEAELAHLVSELRSLVLQAPSSVYNHATVQKFHHAEWMRASDVPPLDERFIPVITRAAILSGGR